MLLQTSVIAAGIGAALGPSRAAEPLRKDGVIPLPGVVGRIDHLAIDAEGKRIFVAALGNNSLEVVNLATKKVERSIKNLHEPQGVAYIKDQRLVAVANGEGGACRLFDAESLKPISTIDFASDADNIRYDPRDGLMYVGFGNGALGVYDTRMKQRRKDISLPSHPESFQLESNGNRIYVNLPKSQQIAVVNRKDGSITDTWPLHAARSNFPMALDESNGRLFVGCRNPAVVLVLNTKDGSVIAQLPTVGDTDDLFYDKRAKRLYVAGGEGFVVTFEQQDSKLVQLTKIKTSAGARTALFSPELSKLFVAAPHRESQAAELQIYSVDGVQ